MHAGITVAPAINISGVLNLIENTITKDAVMLTDQSRHFHCHILLAWSHDLNLMKLVRTNVIATTSQIRFSIKRNLLSGTQRPW